MKGSNNKRNKLRGVTEIVNPNHKRKINEDTTWVDLGSGNRPTNSTAQTFGLFYTGTNIAVIDQNTGQDVTGVFGGLGGVEAVSSQVTYGGEGGPVSVDPPTYNQLAVAGFAKPLGKYDNFIRKSAAKKASQINDQLDASEKVAARANADVLMKARVEEAEKIYNDLMNKYEAEKKAVDEYNLNLDNEYDKEKERVRVHNEKITYQHHKTMAGMTWDSKRKMAVPDIDNVPPGSDLDIQNKLNAKYVTVGEYGNAVMSISPEKWAQLFDEMGGKANEETRKRLEKKYKPDPERPPYKEYPPYPDYPDVNDDSIWNDGLNSSTNTVSINFENNPIIDDPNKLKEVVDQIKDPEIKEAIKEVISSKGDMITASAKVFGLYLAGKLDVVTNEIVGDLYMDQLIKNQQFDVLEGDTTYGNDGIVGSAPLPTYEDGMLTQTANFGFNTNMEEISSNWEKGVYQKNGAKGLAQLIVHGGYAVLGELIPALNYAIDANVDPAGPGLAQVGGVLASAAISSSKFFGKGKDIPVKLTYSVEELKKKNKEEYDNLVYAGVIPKPKDWTHSSTGSSQTKEEQTPQMTEKGKKIFAKLGFREDGTSKKLKEGKTFKNFMSSINN